MVAIFIVEFDGAGQPADPVLRWHGPLVDEVFCDWIAFEEQCDETSQVQPEKEFPSERHLRRTGWLCVGVRPPRPMPRGLRSTLVAQPGASGTAPPGVMGVALECYDPDPIDATFDVADYDGNDGALPRTTWHFSTDTFTHTTLADPLEYTDQDFVFNAVVRYRASDGTEWGILQADPSWAGVGVLPNDPVAALAIARRNLPPPVDKTRSIVFRGVDAMPPGLCPPPHLVAPTAVVSPPFPPSLVEIPMFGSITYRAHVSVALPVGTNITRMLIAGPPFNFGTTHAVAIGQAPSSERRWRFFWTNHLLEQTEVQIAAGQDLKCHWTHTVSNNEVAWFIDDVEQVRWEGPPRARSMCGNTFWWDKSGVIDVLTSPFVDLGLT
ncbi:hypothetical protein ES703_93363 [subsurface metagenome]